MNDNHCSKTLGLAALLVAATIAAIPGATAADVRHVSWTMPATTLDDFADLAIAKECSDAAAVVFDLADLREIYPFLRGEGEAPAAFVLQLGDLRGLAQPSGEACGNICACGGCVKVRADFACTACGTCCGEGVACYAHCTAGISGTVTSTCGCGASSPDGGDFLRGTASPHTVDMLVAQVRGGGVIG